MLTTCHLQTPDNRLHLHVEQADLRLAVYSQDLILNWYYVTESNIKFENEYIPLR